MTTKYMLYSLDVGQGMCTFLAYYKDGPPTLTSIVLFDIGSTKNKTRIKGAVLEFLAEQIKKRAPEDGYLDAMFISHKDADHVNLISDLLKAVPNAKIGLVRYGGRSDWYRGTLLADLGKRVDDVEGKPKGYPIAHSRWNSDEGKFEDPIWKSPDGSVNAFLLCVNTPRGDESGVESDMSSRPDGDQANSKSLVVALQMDEIWAIIGGDATYPSFQYINGYFKKKLSKNIMTLLPHHGSRKTTFGLGATDGIISGEAREVVTTFARRMGGKTVVASADTKHGHPSLETVDLFAQFTMMAPWWSDRSLGDGIHYVTTYVDLNLNSAVTRDSYWTYQTGDNVYSTLYFNALNPAPFSYPPYARLSPKKKEEEMKDAPAPEGMNWIYASNGTLEGSSLTGLDSNRSPRQVTEALLHADLYIGMKLPVSLEPAPRATVSIRTRALGVPRPAIAAPRHMSAFSRLERVA